CYDLVIVSAGGYPKDMQMYQVIKTLKNAAKITKEHGHILLIAKCQELYGNGTFQYWTEMKQDRQQTVHYLNQTFVLGAHKLTQLDGVLSKHTVHLYSDMPD